MTEVSIASCRDYEKEHCKFALEEALKPLGGLDWVRPGMRIVIKANLVSPMKPEKAATTHPTLLAELTRMLVARGAEVVVGDSPGGIYTAAYLHRVYSVTGMQQVVDAGGKLNENFEQREADFPEAYVAKSFAYTAYLDEADAIISFCKLKSHGMMSMSAATKNLFGAVPGTIKPEYHFKYPEPLDFAGMIVDLNRYFQPCLYLVDAVVAMEGNGPTAGTPRPMGCILASRSCHKLDVICAKLIGLDPLVIPTIQAAVNHGLNPADADQIEVSGRMEDFVLPDFKRIEQSAGLQFEGILPGKLGKLSSRMIKRLLQTRPQLKKTECVGCGLCATVCPAKAIRIQDKKAKLDRSRCIRCFCCQEFCPKGAMKVHRSPIARLLGKL